MLGKRECILCGHRSGEIWYGAGKELAIAGKEVIVVDNNENKVKS